MFALSSHHTIERTPEGEDAWRNTTMLPDDRRILGALREPLRVSVLLDEHDFDPSGLEVAVARLARKGYVQIDMSSPAPSREIIQQPDVLLEIDEQDDNNALSALLARRDETAEETTPIIVEEVHRAVEDVSPLPNTAAPAAVSALMQALKDGTKATNSSPDKKPEAPEVHPSDSFGGGAWNEGMSDLMKALGGDNKNKDRSQEKDSGKSHRSSASAPETSQRPDVSAPRSPAPPPNFLRLKDALAKQSNGFAPQAPAPHVRTGSTDVANAALAARAERERKTKERQEEMAARRAEEQRAREKTTMMGLSDRLRKTLDGES
jgi:hypothetical protein